MIEFYGYSKCSSCREAATTLASAGIPFVTRDLFANPLSAEEIRHLSAQAGLTPRALLSTRSRPYRELNLVARDLSDDDVVDLMCAYPALLRRPIVIATGGHQVGFNRPGLSHLIASARGEGNGHA